MIPYGRQNVDDDDIRAVVEVLRSAWLTTGPAVDAFEDGVREYVGAKHAVAVSSGTAALHAMMFAVGIGPGDEVIVPSMTFAATANAVVFQGGTPVFADVDPNTLLIDPASVEQNLTSRTKAVVAVDYAGQPCDYDVLRRICERHKIRLLADACHSLGAIYNGKRVGTLADASVFSFHPVKTITTGEGGMVVTDCDDLAARARLFRNHGITTDQRQRANLGTWHYEMVELGYNYRLTDIQCALGLSQLTKLDGWISRRQEIASLYRKAFLGKSGIRALGIAPGASHAYHLFVVRVPQRDAAFKAMRDKGIGVNVHYVPVHLHPYYRGRYGTEMGMCPMAESAYLSVLSLPMYPGLSDEDVRFVAQSLTGIVIP